MSAARQLTRDERRDVAYREGAVYLRTLGIDSQTELTRVLDIAMNPNSLFVDRQSKLRPGNDSVRHMAAFLRIHSFDSIMYDGVLFGTSCLLCLRACDAKQQR
jgi:hypothetical protein